MLKLPNPFSFHERRVWTPTMLNYGLFALGMAIVWFSTHSYVGLLGAFVASIHIDLVVKVEGK